MLAVLLNLIDMETSIFQQEMTRILLLQMDLAQSMKLMEGNHGMLQDLQATQMI